MRRVLNGRLEVAGAVVMAGSFLVLRSLSEAHPSALRFYVGWFGAWAGLVLSIWSIRSWLWKRAPAARSWPSGSQPRDGSRIVFWFGFAALLRLIAMGFEPALSDDVYRYVWDGRVVIAGGDPYATSPDDETLVPLRDALWERTAHREVESVYPPLAQAAFAWAAMFGRPMLALRLLWLVVDLATCWLLFGLARTELGSERAALLYAWNPLVVVEGVGMGHVDVFGVFWLVVALRLGMRLLTLRANAPHPQTLAAWAAPTVGIALAAGTLIKLVPVVLIPVWAALLRSGRMVTAAAITLMLGTSPIWLGVGVPPGLLRYGVSWEFNGLLFEPLWRLLDAGPAVTRVKEALAWGERTYGFDPGPWYPYVYPQFLAKILLASALAMALGVTVWAAWVGRREARRAVLLTAWALGAATAASATLYPWYVLWLAALLPLLPSAALLTLCFTMGAAYLPALAGVEAFPTAWAIVWLPAVAVALLESWWRRRGGDLGESGAARL